jgi:hypothetical protein
MWRWLFVLAIAIAAAQNLVPTKGVSSDPPPSQNQSSISEVDKENSDNAERFAYYKAHPKEYLKAAVTPSNLSNWILAGLGVVGGFVGLVTLCVIKRQVDLMEDTAKKQLRAYVVVQFASIANVANPLPAIGNPRETEARITYQEWGPVGVVQIKNTGLTPALAVHHWGEFCAREFPLTSALKTKPKEQLGSLTILGAGIVSRKRHSLPHRLTDEQIQGLRNGTLAIYAHGEISYRDIYGKAHFTRYRLMYSSRGGTIGVNTELTFTGEGNETDEEELRKRWKHLF